MILNYEKFCKEIFESAPDAMIIVNDKGDIEFVNEQAELMFHYHRDELIGQKIEKLIPKTYKNHILQRDAYLKNPKRISMGHNIDLFALRKNGETFPVEISLSPIQIDSIMLISAAIRDVTEQKKVLSEINDSKRELELIKKINDAVLNDTPFREIVNQISIIYKELCNAENLFFYEYDDFEKKLINSTISMDSKLIKTIETLTGIKLKDIAPDISKPNEFSNALCTGKSIYASEINKITDLFKGFTEKKYLWSFIKPAINILQIKYFAVVPMVTGSMPLALLTFNTKKELDSIKIERAERVATQVALILLKYKNKHQLILSEIQFRNTFEFAPVGIINANKKGLLVNVNSTFCKMIGYSKEELVNLTFESITHPDDIEQSVDAKQKLLNNQINGDIFIQKRYIRKDGSIMWAEVRLGLLKDNEGKPLHSIISIVDITERKAKDDELTKHKLHLEEIVKERTCELQAANQMLSNEVNERKHLNESLIASQLRLQFLLSAAPVIIYSCIAEYPYSVTFITENIIDIMGYKPEQIISDKFFWEKNIHPEDLVMISTKLSNIEKTKKQVLEYRFKNSNGVYKWGHVEVKVIHDENGNLKELLGFWIDISERKAVEEKIIMLSEAIKQNPVAVIITDYNGLIEYINPKFSEMTGYSEEEVLGKKISVLKSGNESEQFYKNLWNTISSGKIWHGELYNRKKNGDYYWDLTSISPIIDSTGKISHYVSIKEDITLKKQYDEELRKAKEQAESANTMKSEFIANMSHEIRTPMNAIIGFTDLLDLIVTDKTQKEYVGLIKTSGEILLTLINDILDISKIDSGKYDLQLKNVSIRNIVRELEQLFNLKIKEKNINFIIDIDESNYKSILIDEGRFRQILLNLIGNSIKFIESGFIRLVVRYEKIDSENYNYSDSELVNCNISIEDTGIGISDEFIKDIFNPFTQEARHYTKKYEGTGLGLTISKKLVNIMNGEITVNSTLGKGTIFNIEFKNITANKNESNFGEDILFDLNSNIIRKHNNDYFLDNDFSNIDSKTKSIVLNHFINSINPLYEKIKLRHPIKEVVLFGNGIIEIGKEYKINKIEQYGNDIVAAINYFNIDRVEFLIKKYSILLEKLKQ